MDVFTRGQWVVFAEAAPLMDSETMAFSEPDPLLVGRAAMVVDNFGTWIAVRLSGDQRILLTSPGFLRLAPQARE